MEFEVDFQLEVIEDREEVEEPQQPQDRPAVNPPPGNQGDADRPLEDDLRFEGPMPQHHNHNHGPAPRGVGFLQIEARKVTQSIIGALIFPSISAAMGVLLKAVLPKTWTTPPGRWERYPAGFLQSRFGRSIAGGCLFIVLRDTISLYSKYRLAQDHKKRRVLDYKGDKRKVS